MSATPSTTPAPNLPQRTLAPAKPDGRVAFVSGGTRGIGAAIWHSSTGQGATVAAGYSWDREKAEALLSRTERAWGTGQRSHSSRSSAMWAGGPPKPMHPMRAHSRETSLSVASR